MYTTVHQLEIASAAQRAYELCTDVMRWPERFTPCQWVRMQEETPTYQRFEICALANGIPMTWVSQRELERDRLEVRFHVLRPIPLLEHMEGVWRFFPTRLGTLVTLEHRYRIKEEVAGLVPGVESMADAEAFMRKSLDENSGHELAAYRDVLEAQDHADALELSFAESRLMQAAPDRVYAALQEARVWPALLPHCRGVEMRYDDGTHQEFVMTVDVRGAPERIRTIRRCTPHRAIEYFQPEPPPVLAAHHGAWWVEPQDGGSRVVSWHRVRLNPDGSRRVWGEIPVSEALARVRDAINGNSRSTMEAIARQA
jgi:aromatase